MKIKMKIILKLLIIHLIIHLVTAWETLNAFFSKQYFSNRACIFFTNYWANRLAVLYTYNINIRLLFDPPNFSISLKLLFFEHHFINFFSNYLVKDQAITTFVKNKIKKKFIYFRWWGQRQSPRPIRKLFRDMICISICILYNLLGVKLNFRYLLLKDAGSNASEFRR